MVVLPHGNQRNNLPLLSHPLRLRTWGYLLPHVRYSGLTCSYSNYCCTHQLSSYSATTKQLSHLFVATHTLSVRNTLMSDTTLSNNMFVVVLSTSNGYLLMIN